MPVVIAYFLLALLPSLAIAVIFTTMLFFYLKVERCAHLPRSSNVLISTVCTAACYQDQLEINFLVQGHVPMQT